jgi:primosomal protein N'
MPLVAKVRFASPLPQLDKEFDYLVPQDLVPSLKFGQLVQVLKRRPVLFVESLMKQPIERNS